MLSVASIDGVDGVSGQRTWMVLRACCQAVYVGEPLSMYPCVRMSVVLMLLSCLIHPAVDYANVGYDLFLWITTKDDCWLRTFSESFFWKRHPGCIPFPPWFM